MNLGVLYISYDGMLEPLGQSQVLSYLRGLSVGRRIYLISFEKAEDWANRSERERVAHDIFEAGVIWYPLRYHKSPSALATLWDIACGTFLGLWLVFRNRIQIVHARSYVPSVIALVIKRVAKVKYIFDMRGFWADERVDGGLWTENGLLFKIAKSFEKFFFISADQIVSLTRAGAKEIASFEYLTGRNLNITVIPTCVDLTCFAPLSKSLTEKDFVLGYVGSAGTWYLFDKVAICFAQLLEFHPKARFLIVNRGQHSYIRDCLALAGVPESTFEIYSAIHTEVPRQMSKMHAGIFFYRSSFSRSACAPTKLGEFLGCGVPCLTNAGVGDMADLLEFEQVGITINSFDDASISTGLSRLLKLVVDPATRGRCVTAAQKNFSLDDGVSAYSKIYEKLSGTDND